MTLTEEGLRCSTQVKIDTIAIYGYKDSVKHA